MHMNFSYIEDQTSQKPTKHEVNTFTIKLDDNPRAWGGE